MKINIYESPCCQSNIFTATGLVVAPAFILSLAEWWSRWSEPQDQLFRHPWCLA